MISCWPPPMTDKLPQELLRRRRPPRQRHAQPRPRPRLRVRLPARRRARRPATKPRARRLGATKLGPTKLRPARRRLRLPKRPPRLPRRRELPRLRRSTRLHCLGRAVYRSRASHCWLRLFLVPASACDASGASRTVDGGRQLNAPPGQTGLSGAFASRDHGGHRVVWSQ